MGIEPKPRQVTSLPICAIRWVQPHLRKQPIEPI